jgi:hypothetical protein
MPGYVTTNAAGLARALEREAQSMHPLQWVRELVQNAADAQATEVRIDVHEIDGQQVIAVRDNGESFTGRRPLAEVLRYHSMTLHESGEGRHDNYGVGGRKATLPRNQDGVSFVARRGEDDEAWVQIVRRSKGFQLKEARVDGELLDVFAPEPGMLQEWQRPSGTSVFLHGRDNEGAKYEPNLVCRMLRERFLVLPGGLDAVTVRDEERRSHSFRGASVSVFEGNTAAEGVVDLGDGIAAWWWLLNEKMTGSAVFTNAPATVALLLNGEIYNRPTDGRGKSSRFGHFNITPLEVRSRVVILVDVGDASDRYWPNDSRSRIVTLEDADVPWIEWGERFAAQMPDEINDLIVAQWERNSDEDDEMRYIASLLDADWMKRMNPTPSLVRVDESEDTGAIGKPLPDAGRDVGRRESRENNADEPSRRAVVRPLGDMPVETRNRPDLPRVSWIDTTTWTAPDPDGHGQTATTLAYSSGDAIFMHEGFYLVEQTIKEKAEQHGGVPELTIRKIVKRIYAVQAIAKFVFLQRFVATMSQSETVDRDLFTDAEHYTIALGGIIDTDQMIEAYLARVERDVRRAG